MNTFILYANNLGKAVENTLLSDIKILILINFDINIIKRLDKSLSFKYYYIYYYYIY